jgi:hypothetical protein
MPEWIVQVIISLAGVIITLGSVIAILNKRLGNSDGNEKTKSTDSSSLGKVYDKINENRENQAEHCAERLERCTLEFKNIAIQSTSIETKLKTISDDVKELKTMVMNGHKKEVC